MGVNEFIGTLITRDNTVEKVALIEEFLDVMWHERGLSDNTLASYRNDLTTV